MNTKLHAVTDANGRPLSLFVAAGQVSDCTGSAAPLEDRPMAQQMLANRGYKQTALGTPFRQRGSDPAFRDGNPGSCP
jgi:transposase